MFVRHRSSPAARRGVVLILILGMLGLLALIGVAFATFGGQTQYTARTYRLSKSAPEPDSLMRFALEQLINDTNNPLSALRGHGLLRDMYGNDGANNGYLGAVPYTGAPLTITASSQLFAAGASPGQQDVWEIDTNMPAFMSTSYNFTRWIMRLQPTYNAGGSPYYNVSQTYEVLGVAASGNNLRLTVSGARVLPSYSFATPDVGGTTTTAGMTPPAAGVTFELDGRFLRGFNGTGLTTAAQFGNFRVNGLLLESGLGVPRPFPGTSLPATMQVLGNADSIGADEDYDAPDLENWFLGLQSADGQVIIPSFHRPGILTVQTNASGQVTYSDWTATGLSAASIASQSRILRPRAVDHPASGSTLQANGIYTGGAFPDLIPDTSGTPATNPNFGKIKYDVDNDGDGVTDAVWLDLGHPATRDATGRLYKPLFAFTILGLNGKLPLNTAGNLNARATVNDPPTGTPVLFEGDPTYDHTSHLGASPSEINPKYALQNAADPGHDGTTADAGMTTYQQFDNAGVQVNLTQLRNLLAGTRKPGSASADANQVLVDGNAVTLPNNVTDGGEAPGAPRKTDAVEGRWGEAEAITDYLAPAPARADLTFQSYNVTARAGRSPVLINGTPYYWVDGVDDNYDALDFFPLYRANVTGGEQGHLVTSYDQAGNAYPSVGQTLLPSERSRRFVTPTDPSGNGFLLPWDGVFDPAWPYGLGPDNFGRVSFFHYFRPPGVPVDVYNPPSGNPASIPILPYTPVGGPATSAVLADNKHNVYHGYESFRNPAGGNGGFRAGMPYNLSNAGNYLDGGGNPIGPRPPTNLYDSLTRYVGTFDANINSADNPGNPNAAAFPGRQVGNAFSIGSMTWNNPDEMNLYRSTPYDSPYGPTDLEWLYRSQDIDGASLTSRLADLAPVSFTNKKDGITRRRLFSTDTWERNNFAFAHDNPGNRFNGNSRFPTFVPGNTAANQLLASQTAIPNASFLSLDVQSNAPSYTPTGAFPTPAIAHGDRKINLNFPLPHSYDPDEPVRQKWIAETYAFLKTILAPQAVDTPQELAALSQFVINIVDFRDPDNAITIFQNPDVSQEPATDKTPPVLHSQLTSTGAADPLFDPVTQPLTQYGMEYSPIAINEVLGYQFNYADPAITSGSDRNKPVNRLFIELVNTLTKDASTPPGGGTNPSDLDLNGWEFVLLREDPAKPALSRPDPATGQIPAGAPTYDRIVVSTGKKVVAPVPTPSQYAPLSPPVRALLADGNPTNADTGSTPNDYFYVMSGTAYGGTALAAIPETSPTGGPRSEKRFAPGTWDLMPPTSAITGSGSYYWLYLLRPADPMVTDPTDLYNTPRVVVDSIRFPFSASDGKGETISMMGVEVERKQQTPDGAPNQNLYSVARRQPYRGGQLVPDPANTANPLYYYGYSEQPNPGPGSSGHYGEYDNPAIGGNFRTTREIIHTIGATNSSEHWDYPVFNDRDFTSVAELLLVPGCPPGLFTKRFAEDPPPLPTPASSAFKDIPPTSQPSGTGLSNSFDPKEPHTYPYLVDKFYYTAAATMTTPPAVVDGPTGAGWHRMLEFFEVPSPALGAIGPIEQGQNFDWYREDLRPGLINLNLIIDEEVFFGLIDDPRLINDPFSATILAGNQVPLVVTQVDGNGTPTAYYPMSDLVKYPNGRGFTYFVNASGNLDPTAAIPVSGMKTAFADFLKLRHGGSGFLYAHGSGAVGAPFQPIPPATMPTADPHVAADRPFRSLSFPDINYTVMRPATLPPSTLTSPELSPPEQSPPGTGPATDAVDPGVKNRLFPGNVFPAPAPPAPPAVPPIPPRRLFQVADSEETDTAAGSQISAASLPGQASTGAGTSPYTPTQTFNTANDVSQAAIALSAAAKVSGTYASLSQDATRYLGNGEMTFMGNDHRRHPYYRTEMLQKILNLTTVRTHQYAVWVTIGLFEVKQAGDPVQAIPDQLGQELDVLTGRNVRYRSFFILDRSRATGFNPSNPSNYADLVVYSRRIE